MARKKAAPKPPKEKKERPIREEYVLASMMAEKLYPYPIEDGQEDIFKRERTGTIKMALKHFSDLCGNGAEAKGYKKYEYAEVYLAWCDLYERYLSESDNGSWKNPPTLAAVAYGQNPFIERWRKEVVENLPAVYDSFSHDEYVEKYAHILRTVGFHYGATDCPGRLTLAQVQELGL